MAYSGMFSLVLLIAGLSVVSCVQQPAVDSYRSKPGLRIINGNNAGRGQFPWQAWLECVRYNFLSTGCGGSLITDMHILTAAHCISRAILCKVSLGLVSLKEGGEYFYLYSGSLLPHEDYDENKYINDIALIRLRSPIRLSADIHPIRIAKRFQNSLTLSGTRAIISGWGKIMDEQQNQNNYLQYAQVRIMPQNLCKDFYMKNFGVIIGDGQLCTDSLSSNVCNGDSGGPLAMLEEDNNWTLIGIVSLGASPCEQLLPSVYTAVANYLPWIHFNTQ